MTRSITGSSNREFDRPPGIAFSTHSRSVDWLRFARLTVEAVGLLGFLWLICAAAWGASS